MSGSAGLLCGPTGVPGAGGPAAREARRPHFVRRRASKPAPALRTLRCPPHQWCLAVVCAGGRRPSCLLLLVAPRAFRAPRGMSCGPGCFVCPWAAARPRAVRAASLRLGASSRSPARPRHRPRAPQPGPPIPRGALHTSGACVAVNCSARPRHRPPAPRPGPPDPPLVCVFWIGSSLLDRNGASG